VVALLAHQSLASVVSQPQAGCPFSGEAGNQCTILVSHPCSWSRPARLRGRTASKAPCTASVSMEAIRPRDKASSASWIKAAVRSVAERSGMAPNWCGCSTLCLIAPWHFQRFGLGATIIKPRYKLLLMAIHVKLIYIYVAPILTDHRVCPVKPVLMIPHARHFQSSGLGAMLVKA
jgi:hypothetical protein